jgi:hypothetical protein
MINAAKSRTGTAKKLIRKMGIAIKTKNEQTRNSPKYLKNKFSYFRPRPLLWPPYG